MASISVLFGGQEQRVCQLDKPRMVVGREPNCDICIDNLGISRQHCAFATKGDAFVVQDLGSANGTFVNGKKIVEHFLNDGDEVVIGKYILKFKNEAQTSAAPEQEGENKVPDTLNTYVMDGSKIQEQLAKMRANTGGAAGAAASATPGPGATAKDYAKALDAPDMGGAAGEQAAKFKLLFFISLAVNLVLLGAVVLLFLKLQNQTDTPTPPTPPPAVLHG